MPRVRLTLRRIYSRELEERLLRSSGADRWTTAGSSRSATSHTAEDRAIVDNNQAGVSSLRYTGGSYQPKEQPTLDMFRWCLAQLEGTLARP